MMVMASALGGVWAMLTVAVEAIPAEPPIGGFLWTVVVPAALFMISFLATFLLYRRFAAGTSGSPGDGEAG